MYHLSQEVRLPRVIAASFLSSDRILVATTDAGDRTLSVLQLQDKSLVNVHRDRLCNPLQLVRVDNSCMRGFFYQQSPYNLFLELYDESMDMLHKLRVPLTHLFQVSSLAEMQGFLLCGSPDIHSLMKRHDPQCVLTNPIMKRNTYIDATGAASFDDIGCIWCDKTGAICRGQIDVEGVLHPICSIDSADDNVRWFKTLNGNIWWCSSRALGIVREHDATVEHKWRLKAGADTLCVSTQIVVAGGIGGEVEVYDTDSNTYCILDGGCNRDILSIDGLYKGDQTFLLTLGRSRFSAEGILRIWTADIGSRS